jgi:hypothetical protein
MCRTNRTSHCIIIIILDRSWLSSTRTHSSPCLLQEHWMLSGETLEGIYQAASVLSKTHTHIHNTCILLRQQLSCCYRQRQQLFVFSSLIQSSWIIWKQNQTAPLVAENSGVAYVESIPPAVEVRERRSQYCPVVGTIYEIKSKHPSPFRIEKCQRRRGSNDLQ